MSKQRAWNPYLAGGLSGLVSVLSVWIAGQFFGASTTFVRMAGMIEGLFGAERLERLEYFVQVAPRVDWQWMFVVGILIGSFVAAKTSGSFKKQWVPDMWQEKFGLTPVKRGVTAFGGGVIAMFGARMADG